MKLLDIVLKLFPRGFRESYRDEFTAYFELEGERHRGFFARAGWLSAIAFDLVRSAVRVRFLEDPEPTPGPSAARRLRGVGFAQEISHAFRSLAGAPMSSGIIVLTLGIAVGMSTAIFSVVENVLLSPLPYRAPERLVQIQAHWVADDVNNADHTGMDFKRIRESSETLQDVAAVRNIRQSLTGTELPLQVEVGWASANLFDLLGVSPVLGAGFTPDAPPGTLVLSHHLWLDAFGGEASVLGRSIQLDGHPYTIAGVLPRGFSLLLPRFPEHPDVWKVPDDWWQNGDVWSGDNANLALFELVGRLADGRNLAEAQAEMSAFAERFREQRPDFARAGGEYEVVPLLEAVVGDTSGYLYLLLGAVTLVLLVASLNVMSLLLARARAREKEIGLRLALGASRGSIARMLFTESLLLALAGGVLGLTVAWMATDVLRVLGPNELPRLSAVGLNLPVLAFGIAISLGSTLVFGIAPALASSRGADGLHLHGSRIEGSSRARTRTRGGRFLVSMQIATSLVLWIGAGLLTESLVRLAAVDPGFSYQSLLTFSVSLPGTGYERPKGTNRFLRELEERIEALPATRAAGTAWPMPLSHGNWSNTYSAGEVRELDRAYADYRVVTPGFFETLGIRVRDGRIFSDADARHVVVVNEALARRAFARGPVVGKRLHANPWGGEEEAFEIVGVVADVRYRDLREPARETIYFDARGWSWTDWELDMVVDTGNVPPESLVRPIREVIASMDPTIPMSETRAMSAYVDDYLAENRFALALIGWFAGVTGLIATVGLFGLVSHSVARRAREIGIRMAMGADRGRIFSWVYRDSGSIVALGIGAGLLAALGLTRYLAAFLFDVASTNPATFAAAAFLLAAASFVACYAPARRATSLDPVRALKQE